MLLVVGALLVIALIFGPSLWVKFVMRRYASEKPEMPGTGGERIFGNVRKTVNKNIYICNSKHNQ